MATMTDLPAPRSKRELLDRARQEARFSLGRAAFVRDARVLPIGVPLALGAAALAYSRTARPRRFHRRRPSRDAIGLAAAAFVGAMAVSYVGARVEWEVRRRAWRALHDGRGA